MHPHTSETNIERQSSALCDGTPCRRLPKVFNRVAPVLLIALLALTGATTESARVQFLTTPDDGIQPQATVDDEGAVHLTYFKGDPKAGDNFYVYQKPGQPEFSKPIQVNSHSGSAIAIGTIRGAQMALGKNGRVHVAWNGGSGAAAVPHEGAPMLYARMNDASTAFEPERDLINDAVGLDGGGSVAADRQGNVYVTWHGRQPGSEEGEAGRAVFIARSTDDGKTFTREAQANPKPTGACGCCGMRAFADRKGALYLLYRAASEKVNRDVVLLVSRKNGKDFETANAHRWKISTCPMSSAFLSETRDGTLAAWETDGQVFYAVVNPKTLQVSKPIAPPGLEKRKHPVVIGNAKGETLMVWTEGTGWQKGGSVSWQLFDKGGKAIGETGRGGAVKVWSLVSAYAKPDGNFVIVL